MAAYAVPAVLTGIALIYAAFGLEKLGQPRLAQAIGRIGLVWFLLTLLGLSAWQAWTWDPTSSPFWILPPEG